MQTKLSTVYRITRTKSMSRIPASASSDPFLGSLTQPQKTTALLSQPLFSTQTLQHHNNPLQLKPGLKKLPQVLKDHHHLLYRLVKPPQPST